MCNHLLATHTCNHTHPISKQPCKFRFSPDHRTRNFCKTIHTTYVVMAIKCDACVAFLAEKARREAEQRTEAHERWLRGESWEECVRDYTEEDMERIRLRRVARDRER